MNKTQLRAADFAAINDFFLEESFSKFEERFNLLTFNGSLSTADEGIIPTKSLCYIIWMMGENNLDLIHYINNHKGAWTVELYPIDNFNEMKSLIKRVLSFQNIDEISQLEIKICDKEIPSII